MKPAADPAMLDVMDTVHESLNSGDIEAAIRAVQQHGQRLRAQAQADRLPDARVLRHWLDGYQGLLSHVSTLRDEAQTELRRLQRGREVSQQYAAV